MTQPYAPKFRFGTPHIGDQLSDLAVAQNGAYERPEHAEARSPGAARYHRSGTLRQSARVPVECVAEVIDNVPDDHVE